MIDRSDQPPPIAINMEAILQNGGFKDYHRSNGNNTDNSSPLSGVRMPNGDGNRHSPPQQRHSNSSPVSSPPSSPPRGSPFGATPGSGPSPFPPLASGLQHGALPPGMFLPPNYLHRTPDYLNLPLSGVDGSNIHPYSRSPSYNMVSPNDPTANACKVVDFHGEKIASFNIHGKTMLCLPQAFELFLKNLVGGLHTVYTKCKRLDIHPLVCNVEQVRVLRGLGAIQPGVNRCKLIGDTDFEELMKDCNTSRPGRPPKRMTPITTFASMPGHNVDLFNSMPRSIGSIPFPPPPSSRDIPPFHPFMSLSGQSQAHQLAAQSLLGRSQLTAPPLLQGDMLEKYGHMLRHLQGLRNEEDSLIARSPSPPQHRRNGGGDTTPPTSPRSPALNLSYPSAAAALDGSSHNDAERRNDRKRSREADDLNNDTDAEMEEDDVSEAGSVDCERRDSSAANSRIAEKLGEAFSGNDGGMVPALKDLSAAGGQSPQNFINFMKSHIQDLVKTAMTNAKESKVDEEKVDDDDEPSVKQSENGNSNESHDELKKVRNKADRYLRRFKKEKRLRLRIQDQLELESMKKEKLEEALSAVSYQTYIQLKNES